MFFALRLKLFQSFFFQPQCPVWLYCRWRTNFWCNDGCLLVSLRKITNFDKWWCREGTNKWSALHPSTRHRRNHSFVSRCCFANVIASSPPPWTPTAMVYMPFMISWTQPELWPMVPCTVSIQKKMIYLFFCIANGKMGGAGGKITLQHTGALKLGHQQNHHFESPNYGHVKKQNCLPAFWWTARFSDA